MSTMQAHSWKYVNGVFSKCTADGLLPQSGTRVSCQSQEQP